MPFVTGTFMPLFFATFFKRKYLQQANVCDAHELRIVKSL